jgi:hypothetical protein
MALSSHGMDGPAKTLPITDGVSASPTFHPIARQIGDCQEMTVVEIKRAWTAWRCAPIPPVSGVQGVSSPFPTAALFASWLLYHRHDAFLIAPGAHRAKQTQASNPKTLQACIRPCSVNGEQRKGAAASKNDAMFVLFRGGSVLLLLSGRAPPPPTPRHNQPATENASELERPRPGQYTSNALEAAHLEWQALIRLS